MAIFLKWWYTAGFRLFLGRLIVRIIKIADYFSVGILIKTLFTPFRLIDADVIATGSLNDKIKSKFDKLFACLIGGMIRSVVLLVGLISMLLNLIISGIQIAGWLCLPILPLIGAILFTIEYRI